ncbi:hypothetical protein [Streptomyces sp. NPDC054784]
MRSDLVRWFDLEWYWRRGVRPALVWLLEVPDAVRHGGRLKGDVTLTFQDGPCVRRVERGRRVRWTVDGVPVTEAEAKDRIDRETQARRTEVTP